MADHTGVFFLVTILTLVTVLLIFAMKYFAEARKARFGADAQARHDEMSARVIASETAVAAALDGLKEELRDLRARLTSVETLLKEVG